MEQQTMSCCCYLGLFFIPKQHTLSSFILPRPALYSEAADHVLLLLPRPPLHPEAADHVLPGPAGALKLPYEELQPEGGVLLADRLVQDGLALAAEVVLLVRLDLLVEVVQRLELGQLERLEVLVEVTQLAEPVAPLRCRRPLLQLPPHLGQVLVVPPSAVNPLFCRTGRT